MQRPTNADYYGAVASGLHPDSFAMWDRARMSEVKDYVELLEHSKNERPLQAFFYLHRHFLVEHLRGGHGRWAISQKRLGSEYVTDFMIGAAHSFGVDWVAVELESPRAALFTKSGDPSATLNHAIRQILNWRTWLTHNLSYATRPESEDGLGLSKLRPDVEGLVLIGRRSRLSDADNALRSQMSHDLNIAIHTYDYILDITRAKAERFGGGDEKQDS
jgi:hypothetical protein